MKFGQLMSKIEELLINKELKTLNKKQFQFFPLRTDFNLKYIPIDTKTIVELLFENIKSKNTGNKTKNDYY